MEDLIFFAPAILTGCILAATCSLLGVFVITKRIVFIGITLSEVAAAGVATGLAVGISPVFTAIAATLAASILLTLPFTNIRLPQDAILGIVFLMAAAFSLLILQENALGTEEVEAMLYGRLLFTTWSDFYVALTAVIIILSLFLLFFTPILYSFLDRNAAKVANINVAKYELIYFSLLALLVAVTTHLVGTLLTFCFLLLPAATGLISSKKMPVVFLISLLSAIAAVLLGMWLSYKYDYTTSNTIILVSGALFSSGLLYSILQPKNNK